MTAAVGVTGRAGEDGRPRRETDIHGRRAAFQEFVPRLGDDHRLSGPAGIVRRDDTWDQFVPPLAVADLGAVEIEPHFVMQYRAGGPLGGAAHLAARPPRRRIVHADGVMVRILVLNENAEILPEWQAEAAIVVHVVFAPDVPDHVVGSQTVHHVTGPPAHLFRARDLLQVPGAPPGHDPEGDSLAVGISDETLRIMDGFQVRCGEVGARQAGCIVGSEDHLADREAAGCAIVDHLPGAREGDAPLQPRPPGIANPEEWRSIRIFEIPAGAWAALDDADETVAHRIRRHFGAAPGCALEAAAHASKGWIGRGGGVRPSTRSGRGKARLPDLAAIPKTGHRNAQPFRVIAGAGERDRHKRLATVRQPVHVPAGEFGAAAHAELEWLPLADFGCLCQCRENADPRTERKHY